VPHRDDGFFQGYSQLFSLWPGLTGNYLRRAFYRLTLRRCAPECSIGFGTVFATAKVEIASGVYIGTFGNVAHSFIGRDTLLGSHNVTVLGGKNQHGIDRLDVPIRLQPGRIEHVRIGEDVWIGNGAIIGADVGDHAVVAAGAVVVKPVPPWAIVGGNPARVLADRRERAAARTGERAAERAADEAAPMDAVAERGSDRALGALPAHRGAE
jgi:acetyltransferase-like isoleucine patch superfamily enzyme